MNEKIHIYHTNDIHSHFENWPRIQAFLKDRKASHEAAGEEVFIFDIGDFADRWHPFTEGTMGKGNVKLLNEAGYTAVTIGNNEGITLPHRDLNEMYEEAEFDVIAANLYFPDYKKPDWALPYRIYETKQGRKIAVTGITTYYQKLYELLEWKLSEPFTELEIQLNRLKEKTDMIIVLSHLGIHDDEKIAELFPQVDLILGGHTHHLFPEGKAAGRSMMAAAGRYGEYIGYVTALLKKNAPKQIQATIYGTASLPRPINEQQQIISFDQIGKKQLDIEITTIKETLDFAWDKPSQLPALLCEALHEWCNADCSLINSGLVLKSLTKGRVTKYDLHQMLPHPINPCTVELSGAELKEVLLHAQDASWVNLELKGLGFRGQVMGAFIFHGIIIDKSHHEIYIGEEPINPDKIYKLGTTDMFTFGKFFPEIRRSRVKHYYMPEFLRDIMAWKLRQP
ncbi:bifunctional metallophosphatase/5'-nucleotidase [Lederbergia citrea]|uniref:bifunctional metallophosphatase/5'-nucleotidase n=1 Tax=Lederbergia citrea TaxID=2833581 RepID=UPI001BC95B0A|nr:bifunctional UDP-sugar hydrolase/5'-nucleotidase [Lederbergia citrea]MBS4178544.1 bifunctional metallophosphatase/5'-nucleotidase [Lederbergia citrea]